MKKKLIIQILIIFFPWSLRRKILNSLFNYKIHKKSKIGISLIFADQLIMEENSKISHLTICKKINLLKLSNDTSIGSLNFITGYNTKNKKVFAHRTNRKCELILNEHSAISSRHFLDCNGGLYVGKFSNIAGIRSTFLTHSIDVYKNRQDAKPITIGDYCFVGTGCTLLGGSGLPNYSVLGGGAVLSKAYNESNVLYAGVPAKPIKNLENKDIGYFNRSVGFVN